MNSFKLQRQSCHSFLLVILICCSLCARQIDSAIIPFKQSTSLVRRLLNSIKSAEELGPLKVLTDERADQLMNIGKQTGKIETFDSHMTSIIGKPKTQINFREWLTTRNREHGVEIEDNVMYAEREFIDHLLAWHKEKWLKKTNNGKPYPSAEKITKLLNRYPFSLGEAVKLEPIISEASYLRTLLIAPGDFIERYLPPHAPYRTRFWLNIQNEFDPSKAYWASELLTRYEKFALGELEQFNQEITRYDFIDRYVPDIYGVRQEFHAYLNSRAGFSNPQTLMRAKKYMPEYLEWAKWNQIWRPSDVESFFNYGQGEYRLKEPFIKYLYKRGAARGLSPEFTYFRGDIQWEFSSFLHERNNASFAKKILYKFQEWKYNVSLGWAAFKNSFSNLSGWDQFFLGAAAAEIGQVLGKLFFG